MMETETLLDLVRQGYYATYPLIACSIIALAVAVDRIWALRGLDKKMVELAKQIGVMLQHGDADGAAALIRRDAGDLPLGQIYLNLLPRVKDTRIDDLLVLADGFRMEQAQSLRRNIWILGTIGSSAPFIGLFGTVVGIMRAFHQMSIAGTGGFAVVASGISEALVATAVAGKPWLDAYERGGGRDASAALAEIFSVLKGSPAALRAGRPLNRDEYGALEKKVTAYHDGGRDRLFDAFDRYRKALAADGLHDSHDEVLHVAASYDAGPIFDALIIDEVQDFSLATVDLFLRLVDDPNAVIFGGDTAQTIARTRFRFKALEAFLFDRSRKSGALSCTSPRQTFGMPAPLITMASA